MPAAACRHLFSINGVKREIYTIPRSPEPPKPQRDAKLRHEGQISACSGPGPPIHQKSQNPDMSLWPAASPFSRLLAFIFNKWRQEGDIYNTQKPPTPKTPERCQVASWGGNKCLQRPRTPNQSGTPKIPPKIFLDLRPNKHNILICGTKSDEFSTQKFRPNADAWQVAPRWKIRCMAARNQLKFE